MAEIAREQILLIKSALFLEVLITLQKNVSNGSERKRRKLVRLLFRTTDEQNVRPGNVLNVDMKIT